MPQRRKPVSVIAAIATLLLVGVAACEDKAVPGPATTTVTTSRRQGVDHRSGQVMPFDLARARHAFDPVGDGLVETVTTTAPIDPGQERLIREHLAHEAVQFRAGNWDDPARIHGNDMPGLAELRQGSDRLTVEYADVDAGARITYRTADPTLVDALHRWGRAQSGDHGHEGHPT